MSYRSYRNLKTSKALLKSQAHQGTGLFTSAATNQRGFPKGVKRSSGPIYKIKGGDIMLRWVSFKWGGWVKVGVFDKMTFQF